MDFGISKKIVLATASSAGIGFACARALAQEGAVICLSSREAENLNNASEALTKDIPGVVVHTFQCDMYNTNSISRMILGVRETVGDPDILINNTGGPKAGTFFEMNLKDWEDGYNLLIASTVLLYQELIPAMRRNGWGRIVNITSTTSRQPIGGIILSSSFRPGILGLAKSVADEVAADGVTINTIMPGLIMTNRVKELYGSKDGSEVVEKLQNQIPMKRIADPMELGRLAAFLCSEAATYITGSAIAVDGGSIRCI